MQNNKPTKKICAITTISKTMDWFVVDSMRNLSKNGYEVTLICDMDQEFIERNKDYAKLIPIGMTRGINLRNVISSTINLYRVFKKEKFDVVQYSTPNASLYASIASFLARIPIRIYGQWGIRYVGFKNKKKYVFKILEKLTCKLSTHIKSVSKLNMKFAIDEKLCSSKKINVIGEGGTIGVDLDKYDLSKKTDYCNEIREHLDIPKDGFVFGYVGRINADKGVNELIRAFKLLEIEDRKFFLVLVGMIDDANPIDPELLRFAENHEYIKLVGNVSNDKIPMYMAAFDILTHPTYREGFGMVLQEAMAMQVPIITTDVPGPCEVIEPGISGLLVSPGDSYLLKEMMELLSIDDEKRFKVAKEGRKRVEKYFERKLMLNNILKDMDLIVGRIN